MALAHFKVGPIVNFAILRLQPDGRQ